MRRRIGDIAIEVMREEQMQTIGYCEFGLLDEVFASAEREGIVKPRHHPIVRQTVILDALDRDGRFEKFFVRVESRTARRDCLAREFRLIAAKEQP